MQVSGDGRSDDGDVGGVESDRETALSVLADETALAVLSALDEPMTASEVTEACDVGTSTAYRKLETLVEAGLCEERITVRSDGCRVSRYRRRVAELRVAPGDGEVAVETVPRERRDQGQHGRHERPPAARVGTASD